MLFPVSLNILFYAFSFIVKQSLPSFANFFFSVKYFLHIFMAELKVLFIFFELESTSIYSLYYIKRSGQDIRIEYITMGLKNHEDE